MIYISICLYLLPTYELVPESVPLLEEGGGDDLYVYLSICLSPTYELVPEPVPLLEEGGGDDQTVDEGEQHRPGKDIATY